MLRARTLVLAAVVALAAAGIALTDPRGSSSAGADSPLEVCRGARVAVGTLSDRDARHVDLRPRLVTVRGLRRLATPPRLSGTRVPAERRSFRIRARLRQGRVGPDGGIELVVADPGSKRSSMVVELPSLACARGASAAQQEQMREARSLFEGACGFLSRDISQLNGMVTITGVGYFDPLARRGGSAPNGFQLQPVLDFRGASCAGAREATLVAAGDIAACYSDGDAATAELVERIPGAVATLGDNAYANGTAEDFNQCYRPTWGRFKARTHPAPGNHDYHTPRAKGYFDYFGATAGRRDRGYYSYELARWHVIVVNSNCSEIGGCGVGSPQERWVLADLTRHSARCTLAYWHHPRFSSGSRHGSDEALEPIWKLLYDRGADLVLTGHEHNYERFAPQGPGGKLDPSRGIREIVVGTGGEGAHYTFRDPPLPNSQVRNGDTFGVLKLRLHPAGYDWKFLPIQGKSFSDAGSASCR